MDKPNHTVCGYIMYDAFGIMHVHGRIVAFMLHKYFYSNNLYNETASEYIFIKMTLESVYVNICGIRYYNKLFLNRLIFTLNNLLNFEH